MEPIDYEFSIEIWKEDGCWNYTVSQIFEVDNEEIDSEIERELLAYGQTDSREEAVSSVTAEVHKVFD